MRYWTLLLLLCGWLCRYTTVNAQISQVPARDSIEVVTADSVVTNVMAAADTTVTAIVADTTITVAKEATAFKPNPTKAVWLALIPGMGQIYNRKYWKLPIVYGGLMGCMYAVTWNNKNYQDYSEAYRDIMYDAEHNKDNPDAWSDSWQNLSSRDPAEAINDTNYQEQIKSRKDYFRRYRDLSIIITVGVYALSIIDAYVDAQLFDFDISPDLSMRVEPVVSPKTSVSPGLYGVNCSFKF